MHEVLPPPNLIGAPARYDSWRSMQAEAVLAAADSTKRFVVIGAPTGFGKSLVYVSQALLTNARTVILTSTKALQRQVHSDFMESGLIEIRGLNSYDCLEGLPTGRFGDMRREGFRAERGLPMACDEAPCQAGAFCPRREGGCLYYDAYRRASSLFSKLIVTNYAYFMSIHKFGDGLGKPIDLLVLDEGHNAIDELGGFVGTEIGVHEIQSVLPDAKMMSHGADQMDWGAWASHYLVEVVAHLESIRAAIKEAENSRYAQKVSYGMLRRARDLRRMQHKLSTVASMEGDWVIDWVEDSQRRPVVRFDPVWPGEFAEKVLFLGIKKIVLVSATVRPETAEKLGIPRDEIDFREYPSSFPKQNRPVIYCPAGAMNKNSATSSRRDWSMRIDQIIARRPNYKGVVHTVSYPRAREIYLNSEHRERMLIHDPTNTRETIERFKSSHEPLVLVSPVLDTGYDFPHDQARFQIIAKVPFPVTVDKIMKARCQRDPDYKNYVTMVKIVQMTGRIVRAEDDWGETFIIDTDFGWWYNKFGHKLVPAWFAESLRYEQTLNPAMTGPVAVIRRSR